jgi:predicted Ser/Thr protein kinase
LDEDYRDPDTACIRDRSMLNGELENRSPQGSPIPDFRNRSSILCCKGQQWWPQSRVDKLRSKEVIEANMFASTDNILPVISFGTKVPATTKA